MPSEPEEIEDLRGRIRELEKRIVADAPNPEDLAFGTREVREGLEIIRAATADIARGCGMIDAWMRSGGALPKARNRKGK